jgi:hypothetical protein
MTGLPRLHSIEEVDAVLRLSYTPEDELPALPVLHFDLVGACTLGETESIIVNEGVGEVRLNLLVIDECASN